MARVTLVPPKDMDPGQREQYDRFPSNLSRTLLLTDPRLARALPETANALRAGELDPAWREGIILRVAALHSNAYERLQHLDQATHLGWSQEQIAAIEAGDPTPLPQDFCRVLAFVDACVTAAKMSDDAFRDARDVLSDRDLVTVILLVGHYMTIARLTGILQVELDTQPDPWTSEH